MLVAPPASIERAHVVRYRATVFLSAFLLFQVQPMIGRFVLPWFGGGPAVWTTCMLFFQALLLAGYGYAHWIGSRSGVRFQGRFHAALLLPSLLLLPVAPRADLWKPASSGDPSGRILLLLAAAVGVPYFLLSATGPLLQRWYNLSRPGDSPWRLYALSNLGSFLALLTYPFLVEPYLRLRTQVWVWSGLYVAFVALCGWTAWLLRPNGSRAEADPPAADPGTRPSRWRIVFWLALAACGSTLLLATTNQISQDVAVIPFLWVAPLSIYLLTFVLTFESERWYRRSLFAVAAGVLGPSAAAVLGAGVGVPLWIQLGVYLAALFATCMLCHGELARSRPAARHLTLFYLAIAAGGAIGGVLVAFAAPHVFAGYTEFPVAMAVACLLALVAWISTGALASISRISVRIPLVALGFGAIIPITALLMFGDSAALASRRNFYGILQVSEHIDVNGPSRQLMHGRIQHGFQYQLSPQRTWATTYYGPHSGIGAALAAIGRPHRNVAVVGLGTGTLAAWGRPGDTFRFYEINPDVESIARTWFTYLKDSRARTEVVLGDARVQLERELAAPRPRQFDVIAVDAFSSDAIPLHLLTAECGDLYRRRLAPGGVLALHISNRTLDLEPVARGLARYLGWSAVLVNSGRHPAYGENRSDWVLLAADPKVLEAPAIAGRASAWADPEREPILWTDDFSSLWHVLKF